uniref:Uncharacterized protein n=1 Tax=Rhizophora mucronata TaxID=61149 RepID=A0A2P2PMM8_RHIMU
MVLIFPTEVSVSICIHVLALGLCFLSKHG